ncbi:MAG: GH1 family beta-glucosidase [Chloroflexota bacterium]
MAFPKDFLWGVAASSYQIEGGALTEGRGECIWYNFSHTPGKVQDGDNGDVACDHLHLYKEDVKLMADLGVQAYRFSVAWPRVIPEGTGRINEQGLDFYDKLVDELLKYGIQPWLTLNHWDFPQALQLKGGWANPDSVKWFAEYTDVMTRSLGDRVLGWITHNEPWCVSILSNLLGIHAPGLNDPPTAYRVAHHLNLSHGAAMGVIRQNCPGVPAGITLNLSPAVPASDSPEDAQAAQFFDGSFNRWFLDPIFKGSYPTDMVAMLGSTLDGIDLDAVKAAAVPMDFLGINFYNRMVVSASGQAKLPDDAEFTEMGWEIYPQALTDLLVRVSRDYAPPAIYITENGAAFADPEPVDGIVEDPRRVDYLKGHFQAAENAIIQGVPLKGYFVWSLMDNFEWSFGYSKRFGIVHVDYATQKRTPKRSARFYQEMIAREPV